MNRKMKNTNYKKEINIKKEEEVKIVHRLQQKIKLYSGEKSTDIILLN